MGREPILSDELFPRIVGYRDEAMTVAECSSREADEAIVMHHYSHKATSNRFLSMTVNNGMGYMQLGYGIRPAMKHTISKAITRENYCEFDRMWLSDELPKNSESRAIGLLMAYLRAAHPKIKYVITYADESVGNKGTIYKATNAIYLGSVPCDFYVLASGERVHPVSMYHRHKSRRKSVLENIYPGIKHIRGEFRQHRFVYPMDRYAMRDFLGSMTYKGGGTRDA